MAVESDLGEDETLGTSLALLDGRVPGRGSHTVDAVAQIVEVGGG